MSVPHFRNRQDRLRTHTLGQADLHAEVTTFYDGTRTECRVALLGEDGEEFYGEGVARLRPGDHYDKALGQHIAFLRATKEAIEDALLAAYQASITEEEFASDNDGDSEEQENSTYTDKLLVLFANLAEDDGGPGRDCGCGEGPACPAYAADDRREVAVSG